jgi:cystathionine beta-lyase/cystathionine gamma-synthase
MSSVPFDILKKFLPSILANIPSEWRGTTFANSALLGREGFSANITALLLKKHAAGDMTVSASELTATGIAEDYLRVSSNMSTLLELTLASEVELPVRQVFSFGSTTMPIISVLLTAKTPVVLYVDDACTNPFTPEHLSALKLLGCNLTVRTGCQPETLENALVLALQPTNQKKTRNNTADGIITPDSLLYICNPEKINPEDILVIRKRMATPLTTPACERRLQEIAGVNVTADLDTATPEALSDFYGHLQTMSGTFVKRDANPVVFTAGLPAICTLWWALLLQGGADILMASTAYGGSSQLTDIIAARVPSIFKKHTFDITGKTKISASIEGALRGLIETATSNTTVLFLEIPTNPDMKVPDIALLAQHLKSYEHTTGKNVLLVIDTTFAPASGILAKLSTIAPHLTTMVFISMSKSVSRGVTTAGAIIANNASASSCALLEKVSWLTTLTDTRAKPDQLFRLTLNHVGVEDRCQDAYRVAASVGMALQEAVKVHAGGYHMELAFVTPDEAANGFITSTFSFNLPPLQDASDMINRGLAQRFVDLLTADTTETFKPCVSFGQDNRRVYCTVPSTSTQGAIKAEDKAKQLVHGVELARLSFSPNCDVKHVIATIQDSIASIYADTEGPRLSLKT